MIRRRNILVIMSKYSIFNYPYQITSQISSAHIFASALQPPSTTTPTMMKLTAALVALTATTSTAFVAVQPSSSRSASTSSALNAKIRGPTEKNEVLEYGWDGTTALGGAVDNSKPARMLDEIRAAGETQSSACELFNANLGEYCIERVIIYVKCFV